jgi:hypothetical protein
MKACYDNKRHGIAKLGLKSFLPDYQYLNK